MTRSDYAARQLTLSMEPDSAWAMPSARARRASHRALLHGLGHSAPIAIAVFAASYFAAALVSGAGQ